MINKGSKLTRFFPRWDIFELCNTHKYLGIKNHKLNNFTPACVLALLCGFLSS